ncbi:hypothetical protein NMY22_g12842 [Coprinellus aureogranulatus]|nr:hypothetical protein NMY22_g12842 [Coprinellus aureogranulatus]
MDSFTAISFTSDKAPTAVKIPTDAEDTGKGQTGGNYCVVFAKDIPIDEEDTGKGQTDPAIVASSIEDIPHNHLFAVRTPLAHVYPYAFAFPV